MLNNNSQLVLHGFHVPSIANNFNSQDSLLFPMCPTTACQTIAN